MSFLSVTLPQSRGQLTTPPETWSPNATEKPIATESKPPRNGPGLKPAAAPRRDPDPNVENLILSSAAASFPYDHYRYPLNSTFIPFAGVLTYIVRYMDHTMASTKHWTDNCMGWSPLHSMLYFSLLFYIQTFHAMEIAGAIPPSSPLRSLLSAIEAENLWIPGPLVQFFKNLSCFRPVETDLYGILTPYVLLAPEWSHESGYVLVEPLCTLVPHIPALISRLRTICSVAVRDNMNDTLFASDVNGPNHAATLFGRNFTNSDNDQLIMHSPGMNLALPGSLRLWQNAASRLELNGISATLEPDTVVENSWACFLQLNGVSEWFGPLTAIMSKYSQFWKGSSTLAECSPNGSASGGVKMSIVQQSNLTATPRWNAQTGEHNRNSHGNANQIGHYTLYTNRNLTLDATCTIPDLSHSMWYAAITYAFNVGEDIPGHRICPFWQIQPDVIGRSDVSTLQGILASLVRDYHCDSPFFKLAALQPTLVS
ncbi:coat protein [Striga asiatica]|uniref:Coat protein n=1 Tax=Striga asiatica TaxID=4170 RepID=A0A5A7R604_STRAF|nr:coat protein [Striga asiatica]